MRLGYLGNVIVVQGVGHGPVDESGVGRRGPESPAHDAGGGSGALGGHVPAEDVRQGFLAAGQHTRQAVHNRCLGRFDRLGREVLDASAGHVFGNMPGDVHGEPPNG